MSYSNHRIKKRPVAGRDASGSVRQIGRDRTADESLAARSLKLSLGIDLLTGTSGGSVAGGVETVCDDGKAAPDGGEEKCERCWH